VLPGHRSIQICVRIHFRSWRPCSPLLQSMSDFDVDEQVPKCRILARGGGIRSHWRDGPAEGAREGVGLHRRLQACLRRMDRCPPPCPCTACARPGSRAPLDQRQPDQIGRHRSPAAPDARAGRYGHTSEPPASTPAPALHPRWKPVAPPPPAPPLPPGAAARFRRRAPRRSCAGPPQR